jgi:hypothetical protein
MEKKFSGPGIEPMLFCICTTCFTTEVMFVMIRHPNVVYDEECLWSRLKRCFGEFSLHISELS